MKNHKAQIQHCESYISMRTRPI